MSKDGLYFFIYENKSIYQAPSKQGTNYYSNATPIRSYIYKHAWALGQASTIHFQAKNAELARSRLLSSISLALLHPKND
jgi:hypothetical protein